MAVVTTAQIVATSLLAAGIVLLLAACLHDVATRTIPNGQVLGVAGTGLLLHVVARTMPAGLTACVIVLTGAILCWRRGYLGGGDAKLLAATSLMMPAHQVISQILAIAVAGGFLALLYLILKRLPHHPHPTPKPTPRFLPARILRVELWRLRRRPTLPYATAIAAGTLFVLWRG